MIDNIRHVFNRGVNKNPIFLDDFDRKRFVECLYRFNNKDGCLRDRSRDIFRKQPEQEKLVEILKWTLMPNHFHLLLIEKEEGGIVEFTKRLANGYTKYFNIKHKRNGYLFQNATKMVLLESDRQFLYIPFYIDLNPLNLNFLNWKTKGIKNPEKALDWLTDYKWSSYYDYKSESIRDFSCLVDKEQFYNLFSTNKDEYQDELIDLIKNPIKKFDGI